MLSYGKSANQYDLTEILSENLCGVTVQPDRDLQQRAELHFA
jgi:hypothetical protein